MQKNLSCIFFRIINDPATDSWKNSIQERSLKTVEKLNLVSNKDHDNLLLSYNQHMIQKERTKVAISDLKKTSIEDVSLNRPLPVEYKPSLTFQSDHLPTMKNNIDFFGSNLAKIKPFLVI